MLRRGWMNHAGTCYSSLASKCAAQSLKSLRRQLAGVWKPLWGEYLHSDSRYKPDLNQIIKPRHWDRYNNEFPMNSAPDKLKFELSYHDTNLPKVHKKIHLKILSYDMLQYFGHLMRRANSLEKTLMLGKIEGWRKRGDKVWDGWLTSLTQWTWAWANSER